MPATVKRIPDGFHTVTPSICVRNASGAIEFYKQALGATELSRMKSPDGRVMHAELRIGDSVIFLSDEYPEMGKTRSPQTLGGTTGALHIYVEDVDSAFRQAVDAGGQPQMPVTDMFWGDRYGTFMDPFGQVWGLATHKEELSPQEIDRRAQDFFSQMSKQPAQKKTA